MVCLFLDWGHITCRLEKNDMYVYMLDSTGQAIGIIDFSRYYLKYSSTLAECKYYYLLQREGK